MTAFEAVPLIKPPALRGVSNWWPVRLEALAMLGANRGSRFPFNDMFKETILRVMRDPLSHRNAWRWADGYWDDGIADSAAEGRSLYDGALQKIREADFEPARFGWSELLLAQSPDRR